MPEKLVIERFPTSVLSFNRRNARTHSKKQVRQIAASIEEFGFVNPVLIDEANLVIAGHGRLAAARLLKLETVPAIRLSHLSETQKRALAIADNKLAENAEWDQELLARELECLSEIEVDFDVEITGFEAAEIDLLIEGLEHAESDPKADAIPESPGTEDVTVAPGDLWLLGRHRLLCGDARDPGAFRRLMAGESAQMVFVDPPYNVPIHGHVCGLGRIKHREFAMASGEMTEGQFVEFLRQTLANLAAHSADGAIHYVCMDWRHLYELLTAGRNAKLTLLNVCVWNKDNGGMGSLYRSKHELVCVFKSGDAQHINNVELGKYGRYRTNVWDYAGVNTLRKGRLEELSMHPTVKPVALVADAIKDCTRRGDVVLDAFSGSGTTLIAAEKTGRKGRGLELDPLYVDIAVCRWERLTGEKAVHTATGLTMEELAAVRGESVAPEGESLPRTDTAAGREVDHEA